MFSTLEISCLRQISSQLYAKLKSTEPQKQCCNAILQIDHIIERFVQEDEAKQQSIFRKSRKEYCLALKIIIFYKFVNDSLTFHECWIEKQLEKYIKSTFNKCLISLFESSKSNKLVSDINNHIIAYDRIFLQHLNAEARQILLDRLKFTSNTIEFVYQECKYQNSTIKSLIPDNLDAIHYAMLLNTKKY
jgi:hypothetical protein